MSVAWGSDNPSANCITVVKVRRQGGAAGWLRAENKGQTGDRLYGAEFVTHAHVDVVAGEGGLGEAPRLFEFRWNLLGMAQHSHSPQLYYDQAIVINMPHSSRCPGLPGNHFWKFATSISSVMILSALFAFGPFTAAVDKFAREREAGVLEARTY